MKVISKVDIPHLVKLNEIFNIVDEGLDYVIVMANDGEMLKLYEEEFEVIES